MIIILATAILVSVISNNPISEANKARYESDRDNMQAVFTNTVGKIMAENQGVVNVTAGQINTVTKDASEATGEVAYTVDNATVAANASGTIKFDKGTNDATTYYTGKKLPIYAAGETKWYVDSEGVLSLEVAGVKYGSGEVVSGSEEDVTLVAGLYAEDGTMTKSWEQLIAEGDLVVENGVLYGGETGACGESHYGCHYFDGAGKLVIDNSVTELQYTTGCADCLANSPNLTEVIIPNSVTKIGEWGLYNCPRLHTIEIPSSVTYIGFDALCMNDNLTTINYIGTQEQWNLISMEYALSQGHPEITVHCTDGDIIIPAY